MKVNDKFYTSFSWIMVALILAITFIVDPILKLNTPMLVFLCAIPFVAVHAFRRYGTKGAIFFFVATYVLSSIWENMSILTGFPFGNYHYTGSPKLFEVPIIIGPAYISLGYVCMQVANSILQEADTRAKKLSTMIVLSVLSAITMTVYDLATDLQASTLQGSWIWEEGGAFFGVPVSNFLGWWFCTLSFYIPFGLYLHKNPTLVKKEAKTNLLQFIIVYICLGMTVVVANVFGLDMTGQATDKAGTAWNLADLGGSAMLWAVFGMFTLAFLAIVNLYRIGLPGNNSEEK